MFSCRQILLFTHQFHPILCQRNSGQFSTHALICMKKRTNAFGECRAPITRGEETHSMRPPLEKTHNYCTQIIHPQKTKKIWILNSILINPTNRERFTLLYCQLRPFVNHCAAAEGSAPCRKSRNEMPPHSSTLFYFGAAGFISTHTQSPRSLDKLWTSL